jgi:tetratricopeptide (TPR) repeat protein
MNRPGVGIFWPATAICLAAATIVFAQARAAEAPLRRVALLVGVNKYEKRGFDELRFAENDVEETGRELIRLGFDKVVTMKGSSIGDLQATKENIGSQLKQLLKEVQKQDIVFVVLCGHGQQLKVRGEDGREHDDGFFCPVEAVLNDSKSMVSISHLTDDLLAKWGGKNLVLVDACRNSVVDENRGVRERGIQGRVVALPEDTAILFSCRAGQTSIERTDLKHGVFSFCALDALRSVRPNGSLTWTDLVGHIQERVAEINPLQEPIHAGSVGRLVISAPLAADTAATAYRRGVRLVDHKNYDEAIAAFDVALKINPKLTSALRDRGHAYTIKGNYKKAFDDFRAAFQFTPLDPLLLTYRARGFSETNQFNLALADCNQAIHLDPALAKAHVMRGIVFGYKGDHVRAIADYSKAIQIDRRYAGAYVNRGLSYYVTGEHGRAVADFDAAIKIDPEDASALTNRGIALDATGDYDRAIADFDDAIRIDPRYAHAYNLRAWIWASCPDAKYRNGMKAIESANRACDLSGWDNPAMLDTLAAAYAETGEFDRALRWELKAIELATDWTTKGDFSARLKLYQGGKPYREPGLGR